LPEGTPEGLRQGAANLGVALPAGL
jgi:hypothetical protein